MKLGLFVNIPSGVAMIDTIVIRLECIEEAKVSGKPFACAIITLQEECIDNSKLVAFYNRKPSVCAILPWWGD